METLNETKKVTNLQEAYEYVNERYVFNGKHYPCMYGMSNRDKVLFALKHSFAYVQKHRADSGYASESKWRYRRNFSK